MKLLLLLSALFYYAHAQGEIVRKCMEEADGNIICNFGKSYCSFKNVPTTCPNLCGVCKPPKTNVKTTLKKVPCPVQSASRAAKQSHCWKATFNNGKQPGSSLITFYPHKEQVDGEQKKVGYNGILKRDKDGHVFAIGDIENGLSTVIFVFETRLTEDKRVVYHAGNSHIPLLPSLYRTLRPEGSKKAGTRSVGTKQFIDRASVQKRGYEFSIRPVVDKRLEKNLSDATSVVLGLTDLATHAFKDPSIEVNIDFKILEPIKYDQNVTPDPAGWRTITEGANAYDFQKHSDNSTNATTVHLFFTKTPISDVSNEFRLVFGYVGAICNESIPNAYLIEYFDFTLESITRALSTAVGIEEDYLEGDKVNPKPRQEDGKNCTGVGGYMDVKLGANHWTRCSNKDAIESIQDGQLSCLVKKCYDRIIGCENYDQRHCATEVAKKNCPETCGFCKHYNTTVCEDRNGICGIGQIDPNLVQEHICKKHPGYCPWSCKLCGKTQVTVTPAP